MHYFQDFAWVCVKIISSRLAFAPVNVLRTDKTSMYKDERADVTAAIVYPPWRYRRVIIYQF